MGCTQPKGFVCVLQSPSQSSLNRGQRITNGNRTKCCWSIKMGPAHDIAVTWRYTGVAVVFGLAACSPVRLFVCVCLKTQTHPTTTDRMCSVNVAVVPMWAALHIARAGKLATGILPTHTYTHLPFIFRDRCQLCCVCVFVMELWCVLVLCVLLPWWGRIALAYWGGKCGVETKHAMQKLRLSTMIRRYSCRSVCQLSTNVGHNSNKESKTERSRGSTANGSRSALALPPFRGAWQIIIDQVRSKYH